MSKYAKLELDTIDDMELDMNLFESITLDGKFNRSLTIGEEPTEQGR